MLPGARTPPTEPLNSVSPVKTSEPSTSSDSIPAVWPGVCSVRTVSPPISSSWSGSRSPVAPSTRSRSAGWIRTSASGQRSLQRVELGDVVVVVVGEQDVGDVEPVLVGLRDQRGDGTAGVDDERVAVRAGRDEVGVRQPGVAHGAFEDHGWDTTRRCRAAGGSSPLSSRSAGSPGSASATRGSAQAGRCGSRSAVAVRADRRRGDRRHLARRQHHRDRGRPRLPRDVRSAGASGSPTPSSSARPTCGGSRSSTTPPCRPRAPRASVRPTRASWRSATRSSPARPGSAAAAASTRAASSTSTTPRSRTSPTCRASAPRRRGRSSPSRDGVGGFTSLEDLGLTMDLPGDVVEDLRGRVVFLPR